MNSKAKLKNRQDAISTPDWPAIRSAYEGHEGTITALCRAHGIKPYQLYAKARKAGWRLRKQSQPKTNAHTLKKPTANPKQTSDTGPTGLPAPKPEPPSPQATLREALEFITMELIQRIRKSGGTDDAAHEKDARTLSSLVRTYEKLKQMESDSARKAQQKLNEQTDNVSANERRRNLAARLEKLIKTL